MAKIVKLRKRVDIETVETVYPMTVTDGVIDHESKKSVKNILTEKADHGYGEEETAKTLKEVEAQKADHGYAEEETPKSLKEIDTQKADHGYGDEEPVKTLKELDSEIVQLAGDVSDSTEKAGAASLAELNARLLALEKIVSATITHKLEVTKEFNVWGKTNLILIGSGAATFAPDFIGQKYIDTTGGNVYVAVGVATAGNWKLV